MDKSQGIMINDYEWLGGSHCEYTNHTAQKLIVSKGHTRNTHTPLPPKHTNTHTPWGGGKRNTDKANEHL